jgi:hypothetical protein
MEAQDWKGCPLVSIDPDVMHGEPVFTGTRMPVEDAIQNYYAYRSPREYPKKSEFIFLVMKWRVSGSWALRARRTGNCSLPLRPGGLMRLSAMTSGWNLTRTFRGGRSRCC